MLYTLKDMEKAAATLEKAIVDAPRVSWAWVDSFDDLLRGGSRPRVEAVEVLRTARTRGRVLLQAHPGAGKTAALVALFRAASRERDLAPIYANVARCPAELFERYREEPALFLREVIRSVGFPQGAARHISQVSHSSRVVLLIDGVDASGATVGDAMLEGASEFAFQFPSAMVVVADRLYSRPVGGKAWMRATVVNDDGLKPPPLPVADLLAEFGGAEKAASLAERLNILGHYSSGGMRTALEPAERAEIERARVDRRLLDRTTQPAQLQPWAEDVLAACALANDSERWKKGCFDRLSLGGSYFEIFPTTAGLLERTKADAFMRELYAWQMYGPTHALRCARSESRGPSEALELAFLATLAERRWDRIQYTADRATEALRFVKSQISERLLLCDSVDEVRALVASHIPGDSNADWFAEWRAAFLPSGKDRPDRLLDSMRHRDRLIAWTAANSMKSGTLSAHQRTDVIAFCSSDDMITRWRAVHVLGGDVSTDGIAALKGRMVDSESWVVRTAVRSLIEIASIASDAMATSILDFLTEKVSDVNADPKDNAVKEIVQSIVVRDASPAWAARVAPIIELLYAAAATQARREQVELIAERLRTQGIPA